MLGKIPLFILYSCLLITCTVHVSCILHDLLYPNIPNIKIYEADLEKTKFPLVFWFCIDDKNSKRYTDIALVMRMIGNILLEEAGLTLQYLAGMVITVMERQLDLLKVKDTLTTYVCILI